MPISTDYLAAMKGLKQPFYSPEQDQAEAFGSMSPESQNWELAHADKGGEADMSPMPQMWKQFYDVLGARGAQVDQRPQALIDGDPAIALRGLQRANQKKPHATPMAATAEAF